jgi:tyramine---L-glutamate ligase
VDTFYLTGPDELSDDARRMPRALFQSFVPGEPMSASLLVSREGRSWLIAMGRQKMELRDGRLEYRGGEVPVFCPDAADQVRRSVAAIEGLAGFVGVDFIWNVQARRVTILEINPRPTTSIVGLCRLLPEGLLARAWLEACEPAPDDELLESLSAYVHAQEAVVFDEAGNFADRCERINS